MDIAANDTRPGSDSGGLRSGMFEGFDVSHGVRETKFEIGGERPVRKSEGPTAQVHAPVGRAS